MKIKKIIKKSKVLMGLSSTEQKNTSNEPPGYSCPVCNTHNVEFTSFPFFYFKEMDKYGFIHSIFLFETLNLEFFHCSSCGATDRSRLYALYINKLINSLPAGKSLRVLDIAPSPPLTKFLNQQPSLSVRTADLEMEGVDDHVNLTKMDIYPNGSFDFFICSHVLEHIEDDISAMKELYRILKPGGCGIAMVPIYLGLENDHDDPLIQSEAERWKYFAQNDHVRLYSKSGFVNKLEKVGFTVSQLDKSFFGETVFLQNGIHPRSVLYIVVKQ